MRRPVMTIAVGFAVLVLVVLATYPASAERLEVLRDGGSGRSFAIRVTYGAGEALAGSGLPTLQELAVTADAFLVAQHDLIGLENPLRDLEASPPETDRLGLSRVRYQQRHHGLEVLGGEVTVHMNRAGQVTYVKAKVARELPSITMPVISEDAARELAVRTAARAFGEQLTVLQSRLLVLPLGIMRNEAEENTHLAWQLNVVDEQPGGDLFGETYFLSGNNGEKLLQLSGHDRLYVHSVDCAAESGNIAQLNGHDFYSCLSGLGEACDPDILSPLFSPFVFGRSQGKPVRGPYPNPSPVPYYPYFGNSDVDDLYRLLGEVHDYYSNTFLIDGANGQGGAAFGSADPRLTRGFANTNSGAAGDIGCPGNAVFSRSTGSLFFCLNVVVPDVVGHEYSHAVVYHSFPLGSGGPTQSGQTGALNEGTSDFMGELFEYARTGVTDWKDRTTPYFPPWRDIANPESIMDPYHGLPFPARFHSVNYYCGSSDQGGVHHNSTVFSHGMYLISQGGEMNGCTIQAQGMDVAQQVLFRGWRTYFSSTESFNEAYADLIQASNDLYPAEVTAQLTAALQAVELDQPGLCSGIPERTPLCSATSAVREDGAARTDTPPVLGRAVPNPASSAVRIGCRLPSESRVTLAVYDAAGRLVRQLVNGMVPAGDQSLTWDLRDQTGQQVPSGIYFYRFQIGGNTYPGRIIAVR